MKAQLAFEAALGPNVSMLIAWEWTGCLSPNYGPASLTNTSRGLYAQYKAYIDAGRRPAAGG